MQLERLWKLSESKNERIALTAVLGWLLKTVPNAEKLELTGGGGGPIKIEDARTSAEEGAAEDAVELKNEKFAEIAETLRIVIIEIEELIEQEK